VTEGIWELLLNGDTDHKAVLQWWEPYIATVNKPITHTFIEEVCFLKGGLKDLTLEESWGVGAYAYRQAGMEHGPYVASDEGCLMFVKVMPASADVE
jgi:anti-sigma factor ChrR (cupin superfamily)